MNDKRTLVAAAVAALAALTLQITTAWAQSSPWLQMTAAAITRTSAGAIEMARLVPSPALPRAELDARLAQGAGDRSQVDLALVLAVDVSWSMDPEEQRLQRDGYVEAFRDAQVIKAIQSGPNGRIAVTYIEWAGPGIHFVVSPWTMIDGERAARAFAAVLSQRQISRHRMTSISSILQFASQQLDNAPFPTTRRVIDISGDGPNNSGPSPVSAVRDEVVKRGIIINGLPIMIKVGPGSSFGWGQSLSDLDAYYGACVIGGPGSFVIPIRERSEFATATRQKLLLEISQLPAPHRPSPDVGPSIVQPVQMAPTEGPIPRRSTGPGSYDCEIGEKNWRRNWDRF